MDISVQFGGAAFEANIDMNFGVKKFSQVKGDEEEEEETFTDRVTSMDTFVVGMAKIFAHFLEMVKKDEAQIVNAVKDWATLRKASI